MTTRPLSPMARRFAELFAGNGADAARRAGAEGDAGSLTRMASRWLKDPRVQEIIERRRAAAAAEAADLSPDEHNLRMLEKLRDDPTARPSDRIAAAAQWAKLKNAKEAASPNVHVLVMKRVHEILREEQRRRPAARKPLRVVRKKAANGDDE